MLDNERDKINPIENAWYYLLLVEFFLMSILLTSCGRNAKDGSVPLSTSIPTLSPTFSPPTALVIPSPSSPPLIVDVTQVNEEDQLVESMQSGIAEFWSRRGMNFSVNPDNGRRIIFRLDRSEVGSLSGQNLAIEIDGSYVANERYSTGMGIEFDRGSSSIKLGSLNLGQILEEAKCMSESMSADKLAEQIFSMFLLTVNQNNQNTRYLETQVMFRDLIGSLSVVYPYYADEVDSAFVRLLNERGIVDIRYYKAILESAVAVWGERADLVSFERWEDLSIHWGDLYDPDYNTEYPDGVTGLSEYRTINPYVVDILIRPYLTDDPDFWQEFLAPVIEEQEKLGRTYSGVLAINNKENAVDRIFVLSDYIVLIFTDNNEERINFVVLERVKDDNQIYYIVDDWNKVGVDLLGFQEELSRRVYEN